MTFSDSAVTDVVVDTSGETASYGAAAADQLKEQLLSSANGEIDGVSGSTITSDAVMKAAKSCFAQAKGEATRLPSPRPSTPTSSLSVLATAACLPLLMRLPTA